MVNVAIKTKVKQIFISKSKAVYQVDLIWLNQITDVLIYTSIANYAADGKVIDVDDDDTVDECIKMVVMKITQLIEQAIPPLLIK
ncbi:hypothetical protein [Vibrio ziniensis]|uniref:Uncharacterized protein n=1 Tax=Vibrio ziniensis TaxID=2711221 RepID=A0A6G7CL51_9VIBR|nr:hypothetical protein [Vibrio ziniensis]QIH42861.1 hypothetical protein G5S32_13180 [Vibrio ziniensis]